MAHRQEIQKPQRKKGTRVLAILRPLTANRADVGKNVFMSYDDAFWFGCRAGSEYDFSGIGGGHGSLTIECASLRPSSIFVNGRAIASIRLEFKSGLATSSPKKMNLA